ncbi:hypothetical protein TNCV_3435031 [Trichonephila clavipes]|nr:hypothetical protein TNCV_3435031 [Trichonephila clavipes]
MCICHRHTGPSRGLITWVAIGYTSRSPSVRNDGTFNNARYISGVLRRVHLSFIRTSVRHEKNCKNKGITRNINPELNTVHQWSPSAGPPTGTDPWI